MFHICLAIILIILYYTIREFYLLKNDDKIIRENNDITWYNILYLSLSAVNLFDALN